MGDQPQSVSVDAEHSGTDTPPMAAGGAITIESWNCMLFLTGR